MRPDIWSQFLRFSKKASVESFISEEERLLWYRRLSAIDYRARVVTPIGRHSELAIRHYCLDVGTDLDTQFGRMSDDELISLCKSNETTGHDGPHQRSSDVMGTL